MDLPDIARELYALLPGEFTAARNARAASVRAGGDRELAERVKRLRKPSVGAWVLDLLAREHPDEVAPVVELGGRLREAMGVLGAAELRALDQQRRELTRAVAARAADLARAAGQPVNAQVTASVEESLRAAMVDEPAGRALLTGLLTDTFTSTGLDPVDLTAVLAVPSLVPARVAAAPAPGDGAADEPEDDGAAARRAAVVAARSALHEAEDARSAAADEAATAARAATRARTTRLEREAQRDELARALRRAEADLAAAVEAEGEAEEVVARSATEVERAAAAVEEARAVLETAVRDGG